MKPKRRRVTVPEHALMFRVPPKQLDKALEFQVLQYSERKLPRSVIEETDEKVLRTNGDVYTDLEDPEELEYREKMKHDFGIEMYGRTAEGHSVFLDVGFAPSLVLALKTTATEHDANNLVLKIRRTKYVKHDAMVSEFQRSKRAYGFEPDTTAAEPTLATFPFLELRFQSIWMMYVVRKYLREDLADEVTVIEQFIPPILQCLQNIQLQPSSVISIPLHLLTPMTGVATTDLQFRMQMSPFKDCPIEVVQAKADTIFHFTLLSFDIEVISEKNRFPSASEPHHKIICINSTVKDLITGRSLDVCHAIGKAAPFPEDSKVVRFDYETELEMQEGWRDFVVYDADPDGTTHYNGSGFDWPYMNDRAEAKDPNSRFFFLSRLAGHRCKMTSSSFSSKAHGQSDARSFDLHGRIDMDLCTYLQRSQYKLRSYKLGAVAQFFLKDDKFDLGIDAMNDNWHSKEPDRLLENQKYCQKDAQLPVRLWEHLHILEAMIEMSRVTYVFMQDLFSRGEMFKVLCQLFIFARRRNFRLNPPTGGITVDKYQGATVLPPKSGYYPELAVLDFASLYPSIIIGKNLDYTSLVEKKEYMNLPGYEYFTGETDVGEFTFQQTIEGLLPMMCKSLLSRRKNAKRLMNAAEDATMKLILNMRQLALKISCNSIYGFTGASEMGKYSCLPIAATTTCYGRSLIERTKNLIEEKYAEHNARVIYGDSVRGDTCMRFRYQHKYVETKAIGELIRAAWFPLGDGREAAHLPELEVWSKGKWVEVELVIRHAVTKPLYRVTTDHFTVQHLVVTADHSLLRPDGSPVCPTHLEVGDMLMGHPAAVRVVSVEPEPAKVENEYVYDLQTASGHFGIVGSADCTDTVEVHNTDSVMVTFDVPESPEKFERVFQLATEAAQMVSDSFEESIILEMEQVFSPAIMQVKKRYVGLCFLQPNSKGKIYAKGVPLVRRDFCLYQQSCYSAALEKILYTKDTLKTMDALACRFVDLCEGRVPDSDLVLSRKLNKTYSNPAAIMAPVIADKIEARNPGSRPPPGTRVQFVVVSKAGFTKHTKMCDKIDTLEYAKAHDLPIDYKYYIQSMQKSICQLLEPFNIEHQIKEVFRKGCERAEAILSQRYFKVMFHSVKKTKKRPRAEEDHHPKEVSTKERKLENNQADVKEVETSKKTCVKRAASKALPNKALPNKALLTRTKQQANEGGFGGFVSYKKPKKN